MIRNWKKIVAVTAVAIGTTFAVMRYIAKKQYPKYVYEDQPEEQNKMKGKKVVFIENANDPLNADGVHGHLEAVGIAEHYPTLYEKCIKRGFDIIISFVGMIILVIFVSLSVLISSFISSPVISETGAILAFGLVCSFITALSFSSKILPQ